MTDELLARVQQLEDALRTIEYMVLGLDPDYEADPEDTSPDDAKSHIAGLMWQEIRRVLPEEELP